MAKLAVVSGGTKGIGLAIIEKFASKGFDIVCCSRKANDLKALNDTIKTKFTVEIYTMEADMAVKGEVLAFADFIKSLDRPVDVLVNNAGVFIPGQLHSEQEGNLELMMNTNLYSAYHLSRALVGGMMERQKGHIFSIGSIAGITAYANGGSYAISKFAMLGFTKCLREELKPFGIRVTSILPGATYTASWEGVELPEERFMKASDVAETVWLAYELSDRTVMEEVVLRPQLGDI